MYSGIPREWALSEWGVFLSENSSEIMLLEGLKSGVSRGRMLSPDILGVIRESGQKLSGSFEKHLTTQNTKVIIEGCQRIGIRAF